MTAWFYAHQGQQQGPISDEELQSMIATGAIQPTTLLWRQGMAQWQPLSSFAMPPADPLTPQPAPAPQPFPPISAAPSLAYASPMPPSDDVGQNAGMRMLLPVGRSGWAIAAGYLGLLSILMVPAPFAIICGIIAIIHMKRNPRVHGMGRAIFGIVMGLLGCGLAVFVIIGALVGW